MERINLLFDLSATQPCKNTKRHGGGVYGEIVFKTMLEKGYCFDAFYDSSRWLNPEILNLCENYNILLHDISKLGIRSVLKEGGYALVYCPVFGHAPSDEIKYIATLHGLRRIEMPNDWMQLKYKNDIKSYLNFFPRMCFPSYVRRHKVVKMRRTISKPNVKFVTVSNHSKYSILSTFPDLNEDAVNVFYSPCPSVSLTKEIIPYKQMNYFLLVSGSRWEKNNLRAMMALDELFSEQKGIEGFKAIITGVDNLRCFRCHFKNPDRFECKGYVDDDELMSLHAGCFALVYPSLNEGFGYPPLDAMKFGKPVLASAITSIPEVCGDAALFFNPLDYKEIKNRILMIMNRNIYMSFSQKAQERYLYIQKKQQEDLERLIDWIITESK